MRERLTPAACLPEDPARSLLLGRLWLPADDVPIPVAVQGIDLVDLSAIAATTSELLNKIASMGDEGTASATPDCGLYQVLRGHMTQLVDTQNAKWAYMFRKIDAALGQ